MNTKITLLIANLWHKRIFLKKFDYFYESVWRYRFFAYLCNRFRLELFKFRTIHNITRSIMTKKFVCLVCGYVHEGENAPDECPLCYVGPEDFKEITEEEA